MRSIYINGRFLSQHVTGVQRFAEQIVLELERKISTHHPFTQDISVTLVCPPDTNRELNLTHIKTMTVGRFRGHIWEQLELPWAVRDGLLVSLCNTSPLILSNQVVVIHDAAVFAAPKGFSTAFRVWYRFLLPVLGHRARRSVTVSEFSRNELSRYLRIPKDEIRVISEGGEHILRIASDLSILERHSLDRYILAVSSMNPNKNFSVLARAIPHLSDLEVEIVIAGAVSPNVFNHAGVEFPENVKCLGYVSDEELRALYENAEAFIYPSIYEGFGLPPLEAMYCSCPVLCARAASLPEVCGEAARYFDPKEPADVAREVRSLIGDPTLRKCLVSRGRERIHNFSWDRASDEFLEIVHEVCKK